MNKQDIKEMIGVNIKRYRNMRGLKQIELSKLLGNSSPAYISLIESGERNITAVNLVCMATVLKTDIRNLTKSEKTS